MNTAADLDQRTQRLTFISLTGERSKNGLKYALYRCECGNEHRAIVGNVKSGAVRSCGCMRLDAVITHHSSRTPTYRSWLSAKHRATNEKAKDFQRYGAKGIGMCDRWLDFSNFLQDMGERPDGMTLDRIDNGKGYEPSNCRWATPKQQVANRACTRKVLHNGRVMTLTDYANECGVLYVTALKRLNRGALQEHKE